MVRVLDRVALKAANTKNGTGRGSGAAWEGKKWPSKSGRNYLFGEGVWFGRREKEVGRRPKRTIDNKGVGGRLSDNVVLRVQCRLSSR
ncbi:hypothetical protein BGS_0232 [Beggiatoa sp. SS]|nr:hypothetical protein BGS_0232 [Beggiatoa sp. SS]